ncbi:MAG: hypothetical protein K2X81_17965 [Candidatus Obscuribacterales bacterium]|nr:hypothetical protein [Candidatus Obscuribacterales bacterium]
MNNKASNWINVLNEHSEWRSDDDIQQWFARVSGKTKLGLSAQSIKRLKDNLCRMRKTVYDRHFGKKLEIEWLEKELSSMKLTFDINKSQPGIPFLRTVVTEDTADSLLDSLRSALLLQFAADLAQDLANNDATHVQRCEGLYRDPSANNLTMVPEVSEKIESMWRREIEVLKEQSLETEVEIQRCSDLFPAISRSKFCSDSCRFSTFQIIKQLKEPDYLKEKQRRYRQKKL